MFCFGTWKTWDLSNWVKHHQAELGIDWRPHAETLTYMSIAFALLFLIVAIGLGGLIRPLAKIFYGIMEGLSISSLNF